MRGGLLFPSIVQPLGLTTASVSRQQQPNRFTRGSVIPVTSTLPQDAQSFETGRVSYNSNRRHDFHPSSFPDKPKSEVKPTHTHKHTNTHTHTNPTSKTCHAQGKRMDRDETTKRRNISRAELRFAPRPTPRPSLRRNRQPCSTKYPLGSRTWTSPRTRTATASETAPDP